MLLGKRPRGPMRRTTSMSGFSTETLAVEQVPEVGTKTADKNTSGEENSFRCKGKRPQPQHHRGYQNHHHNHHHQQQQQAWSWDGLLDTRCNLTALVSPRNQGIEKQFGRFPMETTTANFLKACGFCNKKLAPGRDIFMYRGEIAFCSSECRQQQMTIDERKENKYCSTTTGSPQTTTDGSGSDGGTIAAA